MVKEAIERRKLYNLRTILFVDEVHRWNKAQQDALLPHVENGTVTLIGATTENPYFEVIGALVSRSRIFQLHALEDEASAPILERALATTERGLGRIHRPDRRRCLPHLINIAGGDARNALNALELAVESTPPDEDGVVHVTLDVAQESIQRRAVLYDKDGDAHYDTISAFIKSVRGSDPDAALYWLAKMLYAGEDPALHPAPPDHPGRGGYRPGRSHGHGGGQLPQPRLSITSGCRRASYPIVACHPLSGNCAQIQHRHAYFKAFKRIEQEGKTEVPDHLKDANRDAKALGHGKGYQYPHDAPRSLPPPAVSPQRAARHLLLHPLHPGLRSRGRCPSGPPGVQLSAKPWGSPRPRPFPDLDDQAGADIKRRHKPDDGKSKR